MTETKKAQSGIEATIDGGTLTLTFAHGAQIIAEAAQFSDAIMRYAAMHGLKQKLVDAAAISRDPVTGKSATIQQKFAAVDEVYQRLLGGEWNKARGDGTSGAGGLLYRALCIMFEGQKSPEAVKEWLAGKSKAEQAALRKNAKVAAIIDTIRVEGEDDVDSEDLLADLGNA